MATPALADLAVDTNAGVLSYGALNWTGTTVGQANDCTYYDVVGWTESGGEYVYAFQVPGYATFNVNTATFPGGDLDLFLLSSLVTYNDGTYNRSAYALDYQDSTGQLGGVLRSGRDYYMSIDGYNGASSTFNLAINLTQYVPPAPPTATPVSLPYSAAQNIGSAGQVRWFSFTLGAPTVADMWTDEALPTPIVDTEIGLYSDIGELLANDDDSGNGNYSAIMGRNLDAGTYYLAVGGYNTTFADGYAVTGGTATGDFMVYITPEPASLALLVVGCLFLRRR
jgi:hypothetical protein